MCIGVFAGLIPPLLFRVMSPIPDLDDVDLYRDEVLAMMFSGSIRRRFGLICVVVCGLTGAWLGVPLKAARAKHINSN